MKNACDTDGLGEPGQFPYTRGIHRDGYKSRLWTMRQYAGMGDAETSNERYKFLLAHGTHGLSVAFDLPTQLGLDSDAPEAHGEVGRTGVAISSLDDMMRLFAGIPLDQVSTSMTINASAAILLAMYVAVARSTGVAPAKLAGTLQNDILKEYIARGTWVFPIPYAMRLVTDSIEWATAELPGFHTLSISGYHMREAGSTAAQELAFTLADGMAYVQAAVDRGLAVDSFAPRLSFFLCGALEFAGGSSEVSRGTTDVGADHARPVRGEESAFDDAAVSHPDGGFDVDGGATREQYRADDAGGAGCGAGRDAVAAHERV